METIVDDPDYQGYYKFIQNPDLRDKLLNEIAPSLSKYRGTLDKTSHAIACLHSKNAKHRTLLHQLALVETIRKLFTINGVEQVSDVIQRSQILPLVNSILQNPSREEEAYYMKLEALWIIANLAYIELEPTMCILASTNLFGPRGQVEFELLENDIKH